MTFLHANNKGADQTAHMRSLISAFVIRYLEGIEFKLPLFKISIFELVSVADEAGLSPTWAGTHKLGFLASKPKYEKRNDVYIAHYMVGGF